MTKTGRKDSKLNWGQFCERFESEEWVDGDIVAKPEKKTSRIPPGFEDTELAVAIIHDEEFPKLPSQSVKARESSNDGGDRLEVLTVAEEWRLEDILRANEYQNTPGCGELER